VTVVPRGLRWEVARAAAIVSMVVHGCVVVAHEVLGPDLRGALFACALLKLFTVHSPARPLEVKAAPSCRSTTSARSSWGPGARREKPPTGVASRGKGGAAAGQPFAARPATHRG
jgi:hypothetical protein